MSHLGRQVRSSQSHTVSHLIFERRRILPGKTGTQNMSGFESLFRLLKFCKVFIYCRWRERFRIARDGF